jgi:uncharacterized sulfatase
MDKQAQDLLDQLEEDGVADNTMVFFYSDHGTGLPRHKRWLYDSGTHVPLIIRFPKNYQDLAPAKPGTTCDRLVSFVDFAPTVLSLLGLKIPEYMQGRAFLGDQAGEPRDYVFAIRDRVDEVYEMSRSIRDHRYQYIRNYVPHRPRMQHSDFSERTPTRQEFRRLAAEGELTGAAKDFMSPVKASEELYDTEADPHQIQNLADSADHRAILERLRGELHDWMVRTRDTGLMPEVEMRDRSGSGSPYDMARHTDNFNVAGALTAAELVGKGTTNRDQLISSLDDQDVPVRYWAATGLAALGPDAEPASEELTKALTDAAPNVRFAAAEALCHVGQATKALPVLVAGLKNQDPVVRLHAAMTLVAIGDLAHPVAASMRKAMEREAARGTYPLYIRWALTYALKKL